MSTANKGHIMLICRKLILIGSFTMHATFPIHFTEDGHFGELTTLLLDSTMSPLVLRTTNLKSFRTAQFASQGIFTTKRYLNEQKSKSCLLFRGFIYLLNLFHAHRISNPSGRPNLHPRASSQQNGILI